MGDAARDGNPQGGSDISRRKSREEIRGWLVVRDGSNSFLIRRRRKMIADVENAHAKQRGLSRRRKFAHLGFQNVGQKPYLFLIPNGAI